MSVRVVFPGFAVACFSSNQKAKQVTYKIAHELRILRVGSSRLLLWRRGAVGMRRGPRSPWGLGLRLQQWLEEVYFDGEVQADFSREDIQSLGRVIGKLLRLEPAERASAKEILEDPWFQDDCT